MSADDNILCINITSHVDSVEPSLEAQSGSFMIYGAVLVVCLIIN